MNQRGRSLMAPSTIDARVINATDFQWLASPVVIARGNRSHRRGKHRDRDQRAE
jgi:hypothetical protein